MVKKNPVYIFLMYLTVLIQLQHNETHKKKNIPHCSQSRPLL